MTVTARVLPDGSVTVTDGGVTFPPLSPEAVQAVAAKAQASKDAASVEALTTGLVELAGLLAEAGPSASASLTLGRGTARATIDQGSMVLALDRFPGAWDGHGNWVDGPMTLTPAQRSVTDGITTAGATVSSATANFRAWDVGRPISGGTIPTGTTVASVTDTQTAALSAAATAATGVTLVIG